MSLPKNKSSVSISANFLPRLNADILRVLSIAVREKSVNPRLADVTILKVDTAPDLSTAKVFVTNGVDDLVRAQGFLRSEIAHGVEIRRVPTLKFVVDRGDENTARVEELLKQINGGGK